jgi:hypothetical protein
MTKRTPLSALNVAAAAKARSLGQELTAKAPALATDNSTGTITTAIHIPRQTWQLMRAVAFHRAQLYGGRASASALITELVERHRKELEEEIQR